MGAWRRVALAGLLVGTFDITYACLFWALKRGVAPQRIFQSVASGLLGRAAFSGGAATAALGLALHFGIALTIAAVYFAAARVRPGLAARPWLWGPLYGVGVYAVMNFVVLPLSAAAPGSSDPLWVALSVLVHAAFIGLPSALGARAALRAARP